MSTAFVLVGVALAVAAPDLVTLGGTLCHRRARRRGGMSVWPLLSVVAGAHVALGVAAVLAGRGMS